MFDWLFEGRTGVYGALAVVAVIGLALWWRDRRRMWLYALAVVGLLVGAYFLLDRLVETRSEQITRRLQDIAAGVKAHDSTRILQHFSPQFRYHEVDRATFRDRVQANLQSRFVDDLTIWDVQFPDATGKVIFSAKPKGSSIPDHPGFIVHADFVKDDDGQWRMKTFEVFGPLTNSNQPIDVSPWVR